MRAVLVTCGFLAVVALTFSAASGGVALQDDRDTSRFEVWIADQSDTRPAFGGQLLIF